MTRKILAAVAFLLVLGFASQQLPAQGAPPQGQAGGGAQARPPQMIDWATALKAGKGAEAAAIAMGMPRVAICVLDANGDMVFLERMDTASPRAVTSAIGHARAALLFGISDIKVYDAMKAGQPISIMPGQLPAGNWEITIEPAGIPIMKNGKMIGAIGAGGIASLDDEKVAQAGIDALSK
jgi:glc operon protein GlcG